MESLASLGDVLVSFLATVVVCMGSCAQESQASEVLKVHLLLTPD